MVKGCPKGIVLAYRDRVQDGSCVSAVVCASLSGEDIRSAHINAILYRDRLGGQDYKHRYKEGFVFQ